MVDQFMGLLLLGLGINKNPYIQNPNVKGEETEISQEVENEDERDEDESSFRLNPRNFELRERDRRASGTATPRPGLDARAFGRGILEIREDFRERVEASREAAKREFEEHREAFKRQLRIIKDTRKQAVVEKLNSNCQTVNEKRTEKMTEMLSKLSTILTNVSNRSASAAASGKDTTSVNTAITTAQVTISDAQSAVASQAGTICTISITSETNLKTDVGKTISGLQQDLKGVYAKVIAARKSVHDAIVALARVIGESL